MKLLKDNVKKAINFACKTQLEARGNMKSFEIPDAKKEALDLLDSAKIPNSILRERKGMKLEGNPAAIYIGDKPRLSTSSDATWVREDTVISVNLDGQSINVFRYNEETKGLDCIQAIELGYRSGGIDFCECKNEIAITDSSVNRAIVTFKLDEEGLILEETAKASERIGEDFIHGVTYSPDGRFLFVAKFRQHCALLTLDADTLKLISEKPTPWGRQDSYPKSFTFSENHKWMFISWASEAKFKAGAVSSYISIHKYSEESGEFSKAIYSTPEQQNHLESLTYREGGKIFAIDQNLSRAIQYQFDEEKISLSKPHEMFRTNPGWCAIHGIEISKGGKVAITDHVTDAVLLLKFKD